MRYSGDGFQPGPPRTGRPISAPVATFRSRTVNFWADFPLGPCLPPCRVDPTSVVGHPTRLLRLHARIVALEGLYAFLSLHHWRIFTRRHVFVFDSCVGLPRRCCPRPLVRCYARGTPLSRRMTWPQFAPLFPCCFDCLFGAVVAIAFVPSPPPFFPLVLCGHGVELPRPPGISVEDPSRAPFF